MSAMDDLSGLFGGSVQSQQAGSDAMSVQGNFTPAQGSNQYGSYPNTPGIVPPAQGLSGSSPQSYGDYGPNSGAYYAGGGNVPFTNSQHIVPTMDPTLTNQFFNMLSGQMGQGVNPFNLSSQLPSSGQATQPGQLSAPMNDIMQQIMQYYQGSQSNIPGSSQMTQMAQTGNPIDQTPAWQKMVDAQQRNIGENAANLREQFAFGGNLKSSPFGNAMTDYYTQTGKDQNALLAQMQGQSSENAMGRELQAQQGIMSGGQQFGNEVQGIDQNAINSMYQEFIRTQPQYNPMMQYLSQASTFEPTVAGTPTTAQNFAGVMSALSGLF